jgi:hypothetical protein
MTERTWQADPSSASHLFTVRAWWEETDEHQREVRMQVRHVLTGETRYFRDAQALLAYFTAKLDTPPADDGERG